MNRIFEGEVAHSRLGSTQHFFTYPVYLYSLDLDEIRSVSIPIFSYNRFNLISLYDRDYLHRSNQSIRTKVENLLRASSVDEKPAKIIMVTSAKFLGYTFNPASFFFCYDDNGSLTAFIAEVSNTFSERHVYVSPNPRLNAHGKYESFANKAFHVSPFYDRSGQYRFLTEMTENRLSIRIELLREGRLEFIGELRGTFNSLTYQNLLTTIFRYPLTSLKTMPRILWQAAHLYYLKRLKVFTKPNPDSEWTIRVKPPSFFQRLFQKLVFSFLNKLQDDRLIVKLPENQAAEFGSSNAESAANIQIHNYKFFERAALAGDIGLGESYTAGEWSTSDLTRVFQFFIRNWRHSSDRDFPWASLGRRFNRLIHLRRSNTVLRSKRNIKAHYDLSNDFFSLFLDPSMTYSSGIFESSISTLEEAQLKKLDRMIELAQIKSSDHLLEIGCGWGSFAIHAARKTGCRITGISLSQAQLNEAQRRVAQAGLSEKIKLELIDYRNMKGSFDKIVSIEMLEAVGHKNFDSFFSVCENLLKPNGIVALQVITIPDHRYKAYLENADWIQKYIFPGGELPSLHALTTSMARSSRLSVESLENFGDHYAQTLREWRKRFKTHLQEVKALGFSDEFIRTWDYYLCYCEAGFNERAISVLQLQLTRPQNLLMRK